MLTELKNRGLRDILIAAIDGLQGFPEAIASVYPKTQVQLCIVHLVRGSLRFVSWKERKAVGRDLRAIYQAPTVEAAEQALEAFEAHWDERFPMIGRKWRANWANLTPFFDYPPELRKAMYTTNAVESINAQLRKVTKKRGAFPTPDSVRKVLYLAHPAGGRVRERDRGGPLVGRHRAHQHLGAPLRGSGAGYHPRIRE